MKITQFLKNHNVSWAYMSNSDGSVQSTLYLDGDTYKSSDFVTCDKWKECQFIAPEQEVTAIKKYRQVDRYRNRGDMQKSKVCQNTTTYVAYRPTNFAVIDVDDEAGFEKTFAQHLEKLNGGVWYTSRGKRQKHYIVRLKNVPDNPKAFIAMKNSSNKTVGEVLITQPPWVRIDEVVHGADMVEMDYTVFGKHPAVNTTTHIGEEPGMLPFNEDEVRDLLDIFDISYWDNYSDWTAIGMQLKGLYGDEAYDLWDEMSQKSDNYGNTDYTWTHFRITPQYCSERSLWKKAQHSDRKLFAEWVDKYNKPNTCFSKKYMPFSKATLRMMTDRCDPLHVLEKALSDEDKNTVKQARGKDTNHELVLELVNQNKVKLFNYMNTYFCVVGGSSVTYILRNYSFDGREDVTKRTIYQTKKEMMNFFENYSITGGGIVPCWLKFKFRTTFDRIVFKPFKMENKEEYNLWCGWVHPYRENFQVNMELIEPIVHHWREVLCDGDAAVMEYMRRILKLCLIGQKGGICLVVSGEQGDGKSMFFEYFGNMIIGEKYYGYVNSLEDITHRFNSMISQRAYVVADEINTWSGDHKTANKLKSLLTQTRQKFEKKGKDAINIDDFANFVFLSNSDNIVKVENKGDRRYACFKSSTKYKGNFKYFKRLAIAMGVPPFGRASGLTKEEKATASLIGLNFMHYILEADLEGFNKEKIPRTELRKQLEANNTPDVVVFARWYFQRHCSNKEAVRVSATKVYGEYVNFIDRVLNEERKYSMASTFGKRFKQLFPSLERCLEHTNRGSVYSFTSETAKTICVRIDSKYTIKRSVCVLINKMQPGNIMKEYETVENIGVVNSEPSNTIDMSDDGSEHDGSLSDETSSSDDDTSSDEDEEDILNY